MSNDYSEWKVSLQTYHARLYRENGKLKLDELLEPMPIEHDDERLELNIFGTGQVRIYIYLDGVERDFKILTPLQHKIGREFSKRFFV